MSADNDPFGFQEYTEQKWAIFKYRAIRRTFWPGVAALLIAAGYAFYRVWAWALQP